MEVTSMSMVFKVPRTGDISKGVRVHGGEKRPKRMRNTRRQDTKVFREEGRGELMNATAEDTELTIRCGKLENTGGLAQNHFNGGWIQTCN